MKDEPIKEFNYSEDNIGNEFSELAHETRDKPFFGTLCISVKEHHDRIVIGWNWSKWLIALLMGGFGAFFLFGAFYSFGEYTFSKFVSFGAFAIGVLILLLVLKFLSMAEKISLCLNTPTIVIRYGCLPFPKKLSIDKSQVELKIYRCQAQQATEEIGPGNTILSLFSKNKSDAEFIVIVAPRTELLNPIYEKLKEYLEQTDSDATLQELELPEGEIIRYSTTVLRGKLEQTQKDFLILSEDLAVFKRRKTHFILWITSILMGILFLSSPFCIAEELTDAFFISLLTTPLGGFCLVTGLYFLIKVWHTWYLVVDKKDNGLWYKSLLGSSAYSKKIRNLSEIVAVQVCFVWTDIASGTPITEEAVYELNVIGKKKNDDRNNICSHTNGEKIINDAARFAEFLGVPLINNIN